MMLERWTDDRLDDRFTDVDRRLVELGPVPKALAVLTTEVRALGKKIDDLTGNPAAEARQSKQTLRVAVIAAVVSSAVLVGLTLLVSGGAVH